MAITLDAGDLFYVNLLTSVFENLRFVEGEEVWMSFPSKAIVALHGTA
jgi:predicted small integral membrane protein